MKLIIDETGEEIPIPETSLQLIRTSKIASNSALSCSYMTKIQTNNSSIRSTEIRYDSKDGNLHIDHGYGLLGVLEWIFRKTKLEEEISEICNLDLSRTIYNIEHVKREYNAERHQMHLNMDIYVNLD